ncbi:MAG: HAMP domain-containing sensor histidine kinase [Armatimonadota bacterium]|nr:HAMP domain-containing sensor histidine kinase [Armatimonadota bacterium]
MPDTSFLAYLTASTYWSLVLCWSAILVFYVVEYRRLRTLNPLVATLIIVIFIDGLRTLIESTYFGTWYTARTGLIPYSIFELLTKPEHLIIPKLINLMAAIIIIAFVVRRWFPAVAAEAERHRELARYHEELVEAHAELQNLENLRDNLIHMIAHDMRTPLTAIIGSLETVLQEDVSAPLRREMLENSLRDAQRLVGMTSDLLDINRVEAAELPLDVEPVNLRQALREAVEGTRYLAEQKPVELVMGPEVRDVEGLEVMADRGVFIRVVTNLLQNGIRHTPARGTVTLWAEEVEADGEPMARISVSDTGEGIPEEIRDRIFDRFFHAAGDEGGELASIGLGLAFCKLAVEAHGGQIWVESELGKGSTFHFTVPVRK